MAVKRKRRTKTAHPGVTLVHRTLPSGRISWRARFVDSDTGKLVFLTLDHIALPTEAARAQWAIRKASTLAKRKAELATGAPKMACTPIAGAIADYERSIGILLRPKTQLAYKAAIGRFLQWCDETGIKSVDQITPPRLAGLRDYLILVPKYKPIRGGKRGAWARGSVKRSPFAVNRDLRSLKTLFQKWRRLGLLPLVGKDAIGDTLQRLETPRGQPVYLVPSQCKALIEACLRYDGEFFEETRIEHLGLRPVGTTARYQPITPFTIFLLLAGCRLNEAVTLAWADVDLQATDHRGDVIGAVNLRSEVVKTGRGRQVSLEVCPTLRSLLATMKLRSTGPSVFGLTLEQVDRARDRLVKDFGAPAFRWKDLRSTCEVYLVNSPAVYGSASIYLAAQQLGHSVEVAQRHYLQAARGISADARTIEQAMQIEAQARQIVEEAGRPREAAIWRATNV